MKDTMISTGEAAALLGVDRRTIRRMVHDRRLRSYPTPSGQHRFRRADVEALVHRNNPESEPAGGHSPILKAMREDVELLKLKAEKLQAEERVAEIERTHAEKEAERQAAAEAERQAQAEQRVQARREEEERDRQQELRRWCSQMVEFFAVVPEGAPPALRTEFYQKATQALGQLDCERPSDVAEAVILAVEEEVFGPWRGEQEARAREARIEQQTNQAWANLTSTWRLEGLGSEEELQGNSDALREALRQEIRGTMESLSHASTWIDLEQARRRAVDCVLAPYRRARQTQSAIASAMQVLRPHLQMRLTQGFLPAGFTARDLDLLARLVEPRLRAYLEDEGRKRELTTTEARQLAEDFIDTDNRLV